MILNNPPVQTVDDLIEILPKFMKPSDPPPVRDAILAGLVAMFLTYQFRSDYAVAQSDILRATDFYLDGLASDRNYVRQLFEGDEDFRTRILSIPGLVTPTAIIETVKVLLASYSVIEPQILEASLDRWFATDGLASFHSFIGTSPDYPDRLYPSDLDRNGVERPNSEPGGSWVFSDELGRYFVLRVPQIPGTENQHMFISTGKGSFVADGSNTSSQETTDTDASFAFSIRQSALDVYNQIVTAVERIKGHSIRWLLFADPNLT